jgi:hypothetical protein
MKAILVFTFMLIHVMSINAQSQAPSHKTWDILLHKNVNENGLVNYQQFIIDSNILNTYLDTLRQHPPQKNWTKHEEMAYWINAYNAYTVQLIIRNYPVKSIKDIGGSLYKVNTAWDIKFIKIGDETLDLNNIEHQKLRKQFDDARIHFAIVCASMSCPILLNEAYMPEILDAQLEKAGKLFLADITRNDIRANPPAISMLFKWYKMDFTKNQSLVAFLNTYSTVQFDEATNFEHLNYNWDLNEWK